MKRIWIHSASALLLAIAVLFSGIPLNAQNSRAADKDAIVALIKENPIRGNGNLCPYIAPSVRYTPAPCGYKPFYISHIGRHGSRFHQNPNQAIVDTLKAYDAAGMLTAEGQEILQELQLLNEMVKAAPGALTKLGAKEHREICDRMVRSYRKVFRKRHTVNTYSTGSQRVLDSRSSFVEELSSLVPGLTINMGQEADGDIQAMEVKGFKLTSKEKERRGTIDISDAVRKLKVGADPTRFAGAVLVDPSSLSRERAQRMLDRTFSYGRNLANVDPGNVPDFHRHYTAEEMYYASIGSSPDWYLRHADLTNPLTGAERIGAGIAKMIIADAEDAMKPGSDVAATLRFSHDSYLLPVMAFMGLTSEEEYVDFENICVACNIQLIFLRNRKGNVLVKVLKNEQECSVYGLEPYSGPYYEWAALKAYMQSRSTLVNN